MHVLLQKKQMKKFNHKPLCAKQTIKTANLKNEIIFVDATELYDASSDTNADILS